jgi:DNA-binding beta-propeller fold protein YncE
MSLASGKCIRAAILAAVAVSGGCARPAGVVFPGIDPPRVWPPPPDVPRIKLLGVLSGSDDLKAAQPASEVFASTLRGPRPAIKFSGPHALAFHEPGLLAVADGTGAAVHIIDLANRTHRLVNGFGEERLAVPVGITWAGDRLFVTDAGRREVIELDAEGGFRCAFGRDVLRRPVGITYSASRDRLYVVDGDEHQIKVFDLTGTLTTTIGRRGTLPGEFNFPTHIAAAGDRLLVADSGNFRVELLNLDGVCLRTIGKKGDGAGDFALPKGVAFDSEGHIYVVDAQFENIQVFDSSGQLLMAFGEEGDGLGEFSLPAGLTIDGMDRIWTADAGNRRIQVFSYLRNAS